MKKIYKLYVILLLAGIGASCDTKQNVWDSGVSSPYHDCSMMEYLRGDDYNWK